MRVLGLPVQFVIVVVVSLALTIFFGAWVADERAEARSGPLTLSSLHSTYVDSFSQQRLYTEVPAQPQGIQAAEATHDGDGKLWERAFLLACPLH